jgi:hypothetical protein
LGELVLELRGQHETSNVPIFYNKPCLLTKQLPLPTATSGDASAKSAITADDPYVAFEEEVVSIRSEIFSRYCRTGKLSKAQHLFKRGLVDVTRQGYSGNEWPPLLLAAYGNHRPIVAWLIESLNLDVNFVSPSDGWTALHCACARGHTATAEYLILQGASITALSLIGETPLSLMTHLGYLDAVKALVGPDSKYTKNLVAKQGTRNDVCATGMFVLLPPL